MTEQNSKFPKDFIWGAATASYQIEGAYNEDGRGESIWDRFSHTPGKTLDGDTGDVACNHYHLWRDDIKLMKGLGLKAYRFSIAWPRILPSGTGSINEAGIDFYSKLVDELLEVGIKPYATLYHWDLPQALQDKGGWPARMVVDAFVEYTDIITRALGDRIKDWITLNEPWVSAFVGYQDGRHAPGHTSRDEAILASHHLLLSHGRSVPVIRSNVKDANVGITLNLTPKVPASPSIADKKAAFWEDGYVNRWFLDPISSRGYPEDMVKSYNKDMSFVQQGDMEEIEVPIDFLGVNYYTRNIARSQVVPESENLPQTVFREGQITEMDWEVYPQSLYDLLGRLHFEYNFPSIYITENGAAFPDEVNGNGEVHDPSRVAYLQGHLESVNKAIQVGVPVHGYFVWSLLDNFEWGFGYSKRFGIVHVDYKTQKRTLKSSAKWYQNKIQENL
ncbi:MAG TPA: beta-glucosidase [Anaerolineae bacterium]|nr:beta-glucosidase [Anaerolineae bacterium]